MPRLPICISSSEKYSLKKLKSMRKIALFLFALSIFACSENKREVNVAGITPSPFVGCWKDAIVNDSIKDLTVKISERNDSLLVAFYWERKNLPHISESPLKNQKGNIIPHACIAVPRKGNKAIGYIVNQYFSVFNLYPDNKYYELIFELKTLDTLTYKIHGDTNYWPDSAVMVRIGYNSEDFTDDLSHFINNVVCSI